MGYIPQPFKGTTKRAERPILPNGTNRMAGTSVKPFRVSSAALRVIVSHRIVLSGLFKSSCSWLTCEVVQGALMIIFGTMAAAVLPVLSYIFVSIFSLRDNCCKVSC